MPPEVCRNTAVGVRPGCEMPNWSTVKVSPLMVRWAVRAPCEGNGATEKLRELDPVPLEADVMVSQFASLTAVHGQALWVRVSETL